MKRSQSRVGGENQEFGFRSEVAQQICALASQITQLGGLKQQKLILSQFWRPEAQIQFYWAKSLVSAGPHFFWRLRYNFLATSCLQWLLASLGSTVTVPSPLLCVFSSMCHFFFLTLIRICIITFRFDLDNPESFPHLRILNLITSAKALFLNKLTFTGSRNQDIDIWQGGWIFQPIIPEARY